jgi:hypothetical protein
MIAVIAFRIRNCAFRQAFPLSAVLTRTETNVTVR